MQQSHAIDVKQFQTLLDEERKAKSLVLSQMEALKRQPPADLAINMDDNSSSDNGDCNNVAQLVTFNNITH
jgi:hypothetical protein